MIILIAAFFLKKKQKKLRSIEPVNFRFNFWKLNLNYIFVLQTFF